jgi:hypothetical protein
MFFFVRLLTYLLKKTMSGTSEWFGVAFLSKAVRYDDEGRV